MITVNVKSEIVGSDIKISTDMQANNEAIEQRSHRTAASRQQRPEQIAARVQRHKAEG